MQGRVILDFVPTGTSSQDVTIVGTLLSCGRVSVSIISGLHRSFCRNDVRCRFEFFFIFIFEEIGCRIFYMYKKLCVLFSALFFLVLTTLSRKYRRFSFHHFNSNKILQLKIETKKVWSNLQAKPIMEKGGFSSLIFESNLHLRRVLIDNWDEKWTN